MVTSHRRCGVCPRGVFRVILIGKKKIFAN